jgi:hypothetical protein
MDNGLNMSIATASPGETLQSKVALVFMSSLDFRPLIVTDGWVIRSVLSDKLNFLPVDFLIRSILGLPQDLLTDREITPFFPCEVLGDEFAVGAAKVVDAVGQILANVNLPIRICDLVDDLHQLSFNVPDQAWLFAVACI